MNEQTLSMRLERVAAREHRFDYEIIVGERAGPVMYTAEERSMIDA